MNSTMITVSRSDSFFGLSTYSREHGRHGRFLVSVPRLIFTITDKAHPMFYDSDCGHYLECTYHPATKLVWFKVVWLNYYPDNSVHGFCERFCVPGSVFFELNPEDRNPSVKLLHTDKRERTQVVIARQHNLAHILQNKLRKRAFIKALSHHFEWGGGKVTLYPSSYSSDMDFVEETRWGHGVNGGLILHEGYGRSSSTGKRYPRFYYAVHT